MGSTFCISNYAKTVSEIYRYYQSHYIILDVSSWCRPSSTRTLLEYYLL